MALETVLATEQGHKTSGDVLIGAVAAKGDVSFSGNSCVTPQTWWIFGGHWDPDGDGQRVER